MSQVEIASNAIKSWTSSLVGRSLSSSSSSSSSLAGTTATARSKLRYRPRASLDEAYAKGKEVESAASTTGGPPPVRAAAAAAEQPSISSSSSSSSSRDDGGGCNERQRRLLQKKQSTIMQRAQERLGRGEAQQHVLLAYSKLAVKWFQKTTTENPSFDPQKVEGQIQQTLDVFNNFLKEWRMEYLLLPGILLPLAPSLFSLIKPLMKSRLTYFSSLLPMISFDLRGEIFRSAWQHLLSVCL